MARDIRDGLACERPVHDAIKADHDRWASETLAPPGHQVRPVFATVDDGWCEQAACVHCGGGITRRIDVKLHSTCGALDGLPPTYACSLPAHHIEQCRFDVWTPARRSENPMPPSPTPEKERE